MSIRVAWRLAFILLLVAAGMARAESAEQTELAGKLRELIARQVPPDGPGAVVVIARNGAILAECAYGYSDVERKTPLTPESVFDLASCSKQFTAMAIMVLADRAKLSFDDEARRYLPELAPHDQPIRISDLLHMTSGLPDYEKLLEHLEDRTNLDVLHAVASRPSLFPAGSKFNYCDTNYVLLAIIVERVSKQSFARFLSSEIFDRLGMKQSVVLEAPSQPIERRAMGYSRDTSGVVKPSRRDTRTFGDGQVMTSALDWVKWDRALKENVLVNPQTQSLAFTSGKLSDGKPCGYGFGWYVGGKDARTAEHGGKWFGTSTYILRRLDSGITVIVLSNLEQFPARKVATDIAALADVLG